MTKVKSFIYFLDQYKHELYEVNNIQQQLTFQVIYLQNMTLIQKLHLLFIIILLQSFDIKEHSIPRKFWTCRQKNYDGFFREAPTLTKAHFLHLHTS